jgi:uncharacterized protein HemY
MKYLLFAVSLIIFYPPAYAGVVSKQTYASLQSAQALIEKSQYKQAISQLMPLTKSSQTYEQAIAWQNIAYSQLSSDDKPAAILSYEKSLATQALSNTEQLDSHKQLAWLYLFQSKFKHSISHISQYRKKTNKPLTASLSVLSAQSHIKLKQTQKAISALQYAIKINQKINYNWHEQLLYLYQTSKQHKLAIALLKKLIKYKPEKQQYWLQLSSLYLQQKNTKQALAVWSLAKQNKLFSNADHWRMLAQLYMKHNEPFQAATTLQQGVNAKHIKADFQHYQSMVSYWLAAKETTRAISAQKKLANWSKNGEYALTLAKMYYAEQQWQQAIDTLQLSLSKKLQFPEKSHMLLGYAALKQGDHQKARNAFKQASLSEKTKKISSVWLRFIAEE